MKWYAAHLILYVRLKKGRQRRYTVWENIVLIRAATSDQAMAKAEQRGHEYEGDDDGSFTWGGHAAEWVFAGVRKLMLCDDSEERPREKTEVTYLELEVASKKALNKLVDGERVPVIRTGGTVRRI